MTTPTSHIMPPLRNYKFLRGCSPYYEWPRSHALITITPLFHSPAKQAELTERFLRDNVLSVNISALRREAIGTVVAPLSVENSIELGLGEKVTANVVEFNCKAAHTFFIPLQTRPDSSRSYSRFDH